MPIEYRIDPQARVVYTTASGTLDDAQLLEHKKKLTSDPGFHPGMVELSDVRGIEKLDVTTDGIRHFALKDQRDKGKLRDYKLAIVASEDVVYGMARMYQANTAMNVPNVRVFRDISEAKDWLGLDPEA